MTSTPRKRVRLPEFDYSTPGAYFFTVCCHERRCMLAAISDNGLELWRWGSVVCEVWFDLPNHFPALELDSFVVMPNHIHGLLIFKPPTSGVPAATLSQVVGALKSFTTRRINEIRIQREPQVWQRGFYEHVLRDTEDINEYRRYIIENPLKWQLDELNPAKAYESKKGRS